MHGQIFQHDDYKRYLNERIREMPRGGHGFRSKMAKAMGCNVAYVSQVLNGNAQFSLEQADAANELFEHSPDESEFFLLLVQRERAGTVSLKRRFETQIRAARERRLTLKNRVDLKGELSPSDQATYYSNWHYAAIHIAVTIPALQTQQALSDALNLPLKLTREAIDFLVNVGLVREDSGRFLPGIRRIFLSSESPMITKHHTNWRVKTLRSLEECNPKSLHFSSVVTLSDEDATRIKELLIQSIERARAIIRDSPEERLHCFNLDFFSLQEERA